MQGESNHLRDDKRNIRHIKVRESSEVFVAEYSPQP